MQNSTKKPTWTQIGNISDFLDFEMGEVIPIEAEENSGVKHSIALVKFSDHEFHAVDNVCTHDNGPLDEGYVNLAACSIECPRHGAQFNIKTGEVISMPAIHPINTYPLKIENGVLYIQLLII
jgi:3-phenylpropionate/trans-cinnamate dioxygenase ferredoxin subunit